MYFGAHVSVAGGLQNAISKGHAMDADVLQIFVSAPQSFRITHYSDDQIGEFKKLYQNAGFSALFFHAIYLINLASENQSLVELSKKSLIHYLTMGDKLGAVGTIVHLGSYNGGKKKTVNEIATPLARNDNKMNQVIESIQKILQRVPQSQKLIVENCAGKKIGKNLEELIEIHKRVKSDRLAFCIDTQHLYASGIDVSSRTIFGNWLLKFNRSIGIDNLVCMHANDSKSDLGSELDRHENIGEGKIGEDGFRNILSQPLLQNKAFILETPGVARSGPDRQNLDRLRILSKKLTL